MAVMAETAWDAMHELLEAGAERPPLAEVYGWLDEVWGPGGWSCRFQIASAAPAAVSCTLELGGAIRGGVGTGPTLEAAAEAALWMALAQAGAGRFPAIPATPETPTAASSKPDAQELIDRLIARLREQGKGREAAALVVKYGGYGGDPETTKRLYGELRALLLEKETS